MIRPDPDRAPCQELAETIDSVGVADISNRDKILCFNAGLHITPNSGVTLEVSLRQARLACIDPDRAENSRSCQDCLGDSGRSANMKAWVTGQYQVENNQANPVRIQVAT